MTLMTKEETKRRVMWESLDAVEKELVRIIAQSEAVLRVVRNVKPKPEVNDDDQRRPWE